ncbi:MAG TPA: sigma-54 dependent transcriptional regulator [Clostridia bacterium]|nr:sigma-54 dependent transcriptional regulator [Clostridia bacterium]
MKRKTLLIEDDLSIASSLRKELQFAGYEVLLATAGDVGLAQAKEETLDLVITDLKIPGLSGLELISALRNVKPTLPIILITAFGTTDTAIEAVRLGAYDYLRKPFDMGDLLEVAAKAISSNKVVPEFLGTTFDGLTAPGLVGNSRSMHRVYREIGLASASSVTVLIRGETGTGKELVATAIHRHSGRAREPFIAVNCTAIPEALLESELFGHERGAFTGAYCRHIGYFEQAAKGTIFLDEIGDLKPGTQAKLLRVLEQKQLMRVGGTERITVRARVLAATHRDLDAAMKEGQFREDLFYRLSTFTVSLPPLRNRPEDIPDLAACFLRRFASEMGSGTPQIELDAIKLLGEVSWPGNVRQLQNVIRHALLLARAHPIRPAHIIEACASHAIARNRGLLTINEYFGDLLRQAQRAESHDAHARMIDDMERELFGRAIALAHGNQARVARWLGVTRTTIREKLARLGLHSKCAIPAQGVFPQGENFPAATLT